MKITNLNSSAVIIASKGVQILCDPWLVEGEHYGSWAMYPPMPFDPQDYDYMDYIYISHIHHDHCSIKSLELLKRDIPVLLHRYASPFMKTNLERLGYRVLELDHNVRTHLKNGVYINILAADNCNPELCHRYYGCGIVEVKYGSTQIDSMCVVDDGERVVVNNNDCPYPLAVDSIREIKRQYPKIDFLLTGYLGAGPFPQCFTSLSPSEKREAAEKKKQQFLGYAENYICDLAPRYYMPFAGTYLLAGKISAKNWDRGNPEIEEARDYFQQSLKINQIQQTCVLLNQKAVFDVDTGTADRAYIETDKAAKRRYVDTVLSKRLLDYETAEMPTLEQLLEQLPKAYERMDHKRKFIDFESDTVALVHLTADKVAKLSMKGRGYEIIDATEVSNIGSYVSYKVDPRLLYQILKGPRYAHWNNAEGGSHIEFVRKPAHLFERPIYYSMNFFHA